MHCARHLNISCHIYIWGHWGLGKATCVQSHTVLWCAGAHSELGPTWLWSSLPYMPLCCCSDLPIPLLPSVLTIQNCPRPGSYPEASQYQNVHALQATTANLTKGLLQRLLKSGGYLLLTCTFLRDHQCLSLVAPKHCGSPQPQSPEGLVQQVWDRAQVSAFFKWSPDNWCSDRFETTETPANRNCKKKKKKKRNCKIKKKRNCRHPSKENSDMF